MQLSHEFHLQGLTTQMAGAGDAEDRAWLDTTSESEGELRSCSPEPHQAAGDCSNDSAQGQRNPPLICTQAGPSVTKERRERTSEVHGVGGDTAPALRSSSKWPLGLQIGAKVSVFPSQSKRVHALLPEDGLFSPGPEREQGAAGTTRNGKQRAHRVQTPAERCQNEVAPTAAKSLMKAREGVPKMTAIPPLDQSRPSRCLFPLFLYQADKNGISGSSVGQRRLSSSTSSEPRSPSPVISTEPFKDPGFTTPRSSDEASLDLANVRSTTKARHEDLRFSAGRWCRIFFDFFRKRKQVRRWIEGKEAMRVVQTLVAVWHDWRESMHRALARERIFLRWKADEKRMVVSQNLSDGKQCLASHFSRFSEICRALSVHRSWKHRLLHLMSRNERAGAMNRFRLAALIHNKLRCAAESQRAIVDDDIWGAVSEAFVGWRTQVLKASTVLNQTRLSDFMNASGRRRLHFQLWVVATMRSIEIRILIDQILDAQQDPLTFLEHSFHLWFLHLKRVQTRRRAAVDAEKREISWSIEARSEHLDAWMCRQNAKSLILESFDAFCLAVDSGVGAAVNWARLSVRLQGNSSFGDDGSSLPESVDADCRSVGSASKDAAAEANEPSEPASGLSSEVRSQDPDSSRGSAHHDDPDVESEDLNPSASGRERMGRHTLRRSLDQASKERGRHSVGTSKTQHPSQRLLAPVLSAALLMESDDEEDGSEDLQRRHPQSHDGPQQQHPRQKQHPSKQQQMQPQRQGLTSSKQPHPHSGSELPTATDSATPSPPLPLALTSALHPSSSSGSCTPTALALAQQPAIVSTSPQRRFWVEMDRRRWPLYLKDPPSHSLDPPSHRSSSSSTSGSLRRARTTLVFDGNNATAEPEQDTSIGSN